MVKITLKIILNYQVKPHVNTQMWVCVWVFRFRLTKQQHIYISKHAYYNNVLFTQSNHISILKYCISDCACVCVWQTIFLCSRWNTFNLVYKPYTCFFIHHSLMFWSIRFWCRTNSSKNHLNTLRTNRTINMKKVRQFVHFFNANTNMIYYVFVWLKWYLDWLRESIRFFWSLIYLIFFV